MNQARNMKMHTASNLYIKLVAPDWPFSCNEFVIWYLKYHSSWMNFFINTWQKEWKWLKLLGVIQTCFKFQTFLTDLIPGFNTSKFLKKLAIIKKVSFRLSSSFPPHWKLSLLCFNVFIAFNSFVHTLLGIAFLCCKVLRL